MKTTPLTPEFLERMSFPDKFQSFKVKMKLLAPPKIKLPKSRIYTVTDVEFSKFFKTYSIRIGNNDYNSNHFNMVVEEPDHSVTEKINPFEPTKPNPDNQTVKTLVQYVSEHKQSMSKESIVHFANLIGLIKLGAL